MLLALRRPGGTREQHMGNRFGNRRVAAGAGSEEGVRDQSDASSTRGRGESATAQGKETRDTIADRKRAALDSIVEESRRGEVTMFEVGVKSTRVVVCAAGEDGTDFIAGHTGSRALKGLRAERAAPALCPRSPCATTRSGGKTEESRDEGNGAAELGESTDALASHASSDGHDAQVHT